MNGCGASQPRPSAHKYLDRLGRFVHVGDIHVDAEIDTLSDGLVARTQKHTDERVKLVNEVLKAKLG